MQQRKSTARQRAVTEPQRAPGQPAARASRELKVPVAAPSSSRSSSGEMTLGGHVDRGLTLAALYDTGVLARLRIEVRLRLISDLTQSLAWLHANPRLMAAHPHLVIAPSTIVIGLDGVARVDVRAAKKQESERNPQEADYVAPEVAGGDPAADLRADIYSVGVLAWEALTGQRIGATVEDDGPASSLDDSDVPAALRGGRNPREPLRRKAGSAAPKVSQSRMRAPPPLTLPEHAAWARSLAELVLRALAPNAADRLPDARQLLAELEALGPCLADTQEIAEVVQGISTVDTLCVPPSTLPDVDAACQSEVERRGVVECEPCEDSRGPVCMQRQLPAVHRVVAPPTPPPAAPPPPSVAAEPVSRTSETLRELSSVSPSHVLLSVGLLTLAVLGSLAGYALSVLAQR